MDINILSALLGAIIGGIFTSITTWWSIRRNHKAAVVGVLQGIHAEIETLWNIYQIKFKEVFPMLEDAKLLHDNFIRKKYPLYLYGGYFTVYDSNSSRIGQIPDNDLRGDIVTGYLRARELVDAYLHNNELLRDLEALHSQKNIDMSTRYDESIKSIENALKEHAKYIAEVHGEMKKFYLKARDKLQRY